MDYHAKFLDSDRQHILMITNHGYHEWDVVPGLPDTGGQNIFVNQFSQTLTQKGYRVTIVNRGGYDHPILGSSRKGIHYKDECQRILFLDDGVNEFVRKEDMQERLPGLANDLQEQLSSEDAPVAMIVSHYWDGAALGILYNQSLTNPVKHIWVPHSLGSVKKRNVDPQRWADLRIEERITIEQDIIAEVNAIASTSDTIETALKKDYRYPVDPLFLPPCIEPARYFPKELEADNPIWGFLSTQSSRTPNQLQERTIISEISRTDSTKRKNILIKAFARVQKAYPLALLVLTINQDIPLGQDLMAMIDDMGVSEDVIVLGSVWEELPDIYRVSDMYCTPSIMEGFGMSAQEAAATKVPVVASDKVPFATEFLLGKNPQKLYYDQGKPGLHIGDGCIVVPPDDDVGFAVAIETLLENAELRKSMGQNAYRITIPDFTWDNVVDEFLSNIP